MTQSLSLQFVRVRKMAVKLEINGSSPTSFGNVAKRFLIINILCNHIIVLNFVLINGRVMSLCGNKAL